MTAMWVGFVGREAFVLPRYPWIDIDLFQATKAGHKYAEYFPSYFLTTFKLRWGVNMIGSDIF